MPRSMWHATVEAVNAANEAQLRNIQYDRAMWIMRWCQVCGSKDHPSYHCCDRCNYDRHLCHFCGDNLGHDEVSACYHLMDIEEGKVIASPRILREWIVKATHCDIATMREERTADAMAALLATGKYEREIAPGVTIKVEYP